MLGGEGGYWAGQMCAVAVPAHAPPLAPPIPAVSQALPLLTEAVLGFRRCGSVVDLRTTLPLLAACHGNLGHAKEQDSVLTELHELDMT